MNNDYPLESELRSNFIEKKKSSMNSMQTFFKTMSGGNKDMVCVSYEISLLFAKKNHIPMAKKLLESLLIAARNLGDPKVK